MVTTGDILEVQIRGTLNGQQYQNNFGFLAATNLGTVAGLLSAFWALIGAKYMTGKTDALTVNEVAAVDVKPGTAATVTYTTGLPTTGAAVGEGMPPQACQVMTLETALKGRSYRGRLYIGGWPEANHADGVWTFGGGSGTDDWAADLLAQYGSGGIDGDWRWAVISRVLNGVERVTPVATEITNYILRTTVYNQRRRTIGVGA